MTRQCTARWWIAVAVAALFGAAGCQSTSPDPVTQGEPTGSLDMRAKTDDSNQAKPALEPVYFDYDRWQLRDEARKTLQSNAEIIKQHPKWGVLTIEGHCDERGSDEYNLALGERRAAAVKRYFEDLGISGKRLETVSFGEDRPAVRGHDETAWRYNRRSEIDVGNVQVSGR